MTKHRPATPLEQRLDEEYAAEHGTTLSQKSLDEEAHQEIDPDSPAELARKLKAEAAEGKGAAEKARRALEEIDRDISGEYERRDDPEAPPPRSRSG